jgi:glucokinase
LQSYQDHAQVILAIDAGGTFLKSALFEADRLIVPLADVPTFSNGTLEEIKNAFFTLYQNAVRQSGQEISSVAVSVPGPFDYEKGIFLMEHKYKAVKNCFMKDFFPAKYITYLHDANAFLGGVDNGENNRVGGITLGTGLGAAIMVDGKFLNNEKNTPLYPLWNKPFGNGIGEDYISTAALLKACPDAKSVKEMAMRSDTEETWQNFGNYLAQLLSLWQQEHQLDKIYIGGGISLAKERFMNSQLAQLPLEFVANYNWNLHGAIKYFLDIYR